MTFSSTVMVSKLRTTWKVRAMPRPAHATGPRPETRLPSSRISPASGVTSPEIELNSEVLPAPFGPIRPRISPACTSKLISTLAATPPNDLLTWSTSSSLGTCYLPARREQAHQALRPGQCDHHEQ